MTHENLVTINDGADLESATQLLKIYKIEKLPVVDKQFKLIGLLTFKDIRKIKDNPYANKRQQRPSAHSRSCGRSEGYVGKR